MSFYSKYVLPRVIDLAMKNPETRRLREVWIPQARGDVLEVGIGSGLNLEFYTQQVTRIQGVDPSVELQRMARKRAARMNLEFLLQSSENPLPLPSGSIDTIVLTWTLCSIPDPRKALEEMKRVLRPDGNSFLWNMAGRRIPASLPGKIGSRRFGSTSVAAVT
jgi:ubiquinone/menaquinone biosynthesis C-methylase UbiE